eukprot:178145_1
MSEYHQITSSYPTVISQLFHLSITFLIGIIAWFYNLYDYICLFIFIFIIIITIWILAFSNLYPYTHQQNDSTNTKKQDTLNETCNSYLSQTQSLNTTINNDITNTFFYSPNKPNINHKKTDNCNSFMNDLPFEMNPNSTLMFDEQSMFNTSNNKSLNGSFINFNKLSETMNNSNYDLEIQKIQQLSEPTNFFQGLVGFSSVYTILNYLNIFDENKKKSIIDTMTKQNYFNLSSLHFSAMVINLFAFILIPFLVFHIFLLYQSQYSIIPICYIFIVLFMSQYGESIMNYLLFSVHNGYNYNDVNLIGNKKIILSYSISTKYSFEGCLISVIISCVTSLILYICIGVIIYGPMCG